MESTSYVLARYGRAVYASGVATLGENIRAARIAAGITTQLELARRLDIQQPQLADWENDRYETLDLKTLLKIAAAIPCSFDALVKGFNQRYDSTRSTVAGVEPVLVPAIDGPFSDVLQDLWPDLKDEQRRTLMQTAALLLNKQVELPATRRKRSPKRAARRDR